MTFVRKFENTTMKFYNKLFHNFKSTYMAMIPLSIIFQSCLGSVAAMYILMQKGPFFVLQLGLCTILCMAYNAAILAQLKPKLVFNLLGISVFVNSILLMTNLTV